MITATGHYFQKIFPCPVLELPPKIRIDTDQGEAIKDLGSAQPSNSPRNHKP